MILIGCLVGQAWAQASIGAMHAAKARAVKLLFNMGVSISNWGQVNQNLADWTVSRKAHGGHSARTPTFLGCMAG
jgi:hypothetical protein